VSGVVLWTPDVDTDDVALLKKARAGDSAAVDELLRRYERSVYRFGLRMCGNEDAAREVLQETLLAAFRHLPSFRGDAALSTWLYQIARSFCAKQRRTPALASTESAEAQRVASAASGQDERAHAREMAELIQAAIGSLPAEAREVLVLRDVEGLSAEEAAQVLEVSVPALKSRLHRARLSLSAQLNAVLEAPKAVACPELAAELTAYAAEEVDQAMCLRIEKHLGTCERCAAACESLKRTVSLCRALPGGDVPAPVKAAVRAALQNPLSADEAPTPHA
jgi:RNA polymerase sigma-70 factor (ECF subfamily)